MLLDTMLSLTFALTTSHRISISRYHLPPSDHPDQLCDSSVSRFFFISKEEMFRSPNPPKLHILSNEKYPCRSTFFCSTLLDLRSSLLEMHPRRARCNVQCVPGHIHHVMSARSLCRPVCPHGEMHFPGPG